MKQLNNPALLTPTPDGVAVSYPDVSATNPYDLFGPDALASLARRILWSEANPNNRTLFVSNEEVARVVALNADQQLPGPVIGRLTLIAHGEVKTPRGRRSSCETPLRALVQQALDDNARAYYERAHTRLKASPRLLKRACRRFRLQDDCKTPSDCAAELTRLLYFPNVGSRRSVMNRLFSQK
jgi:hypothetical protein